MEPSKRKSQLALSKALATYCLLVQLFSAARANQPSTSGALWDECSKGAPLARVTNISMSGCDLESAQTKFCEFRRASNVSISVEFTPNVDIGAARVNIKAKSSFISFPLPVKLDDACQFYGLQCPMVAGLPQRLNISIPVKPFYRTLPKMKVQAKLTGEGENTEIGCISFPVRIVGDQM